MHSTLTSNRGIICFQFSSPGNFPQKFKLTGWIHRFSVWTDIRHLLNRGAFRWPTYAHTFFYNLVCLALMISTKSEITKRARRRAAGLPAGQRLIAGSSAAWTYRGAAMCALGWLCVGLNELMRGCSRCLRVWLRALQEEKWMYRWGMYRKSPRPQRATTPRHGQIP